MMAANPNVYNATWASLQKQLDMVARFLLGSLSLAYRPRLVLKDADTASTDGQRVVKMPRRFLGVGLEDGRPEIFLGLLAHEVGHWLQPIKEIDAVEKQTRLMHGFVNIVMDVHCEHQVGLIFPLFKYPIKAVRELIGSSMARRYRRSFRKAQDFVTAAMAALLYSRYCVHADVSFSVALIGFQKYALVPMQNAAYDTGRLESLLTDVARVRELSSCELPETLATLAGKYPELCCQPPKLLFGDPLDGSASEGDKFLSGVVQLQVPERDSTEACSVLEVSASGSVPPSPDVLALSRKLKNRWFAPAGVERIMAPGRLDRMAALRDQPVPYSLQCQRSTRLKDSGVRKIMLAADWSVSMEGQPWLATLAAAQAITLALRSDGGDVRGLLFAGSAWHTVDFNAGALFFARALSGGVDLGKAEGSTTRFGWLPEVWQRYPDHQVLVLTDGAGSLPTYIPDSCRIRTSALLIGLENYSDEQREDVRSIAEAIAGKVVEVPSLDDLAGVWATLIPRRQVA
jgi:hypothetical protein